MNIDKLKDILICDHKVLVLPDMKGAVAINGPFAYEARCLIPNLRDFETEEDVAKELSSKGNVFAFYGLRDRRLFGAMWHTTLEEIKKEFSR